MPARDYIQRLASDRYDGEIQNAVEAALEQIANQVTLSDLAEAIERGDEEQVIRLITDQIPGAFDQVRTAELAAMGAAGVATMGVVPAAERGDQRIAVKFNKGNSRAVRGVDRIHVELIREITEETRDTIRDEIRASLRDGDNPRVAGRRIRGKWNPVTRRHDGGVLGLTRHQADITRRARERLLSGDPAEMRKYLGMKLRDKRFDRTVINAIEEGGAIPKAKAEKMAAAYRRKSVQRRAETIARDQSLAALDSGQDSAIEQAKDEGIIRDEDVVEFWVTSRDSRVRDVHQAVPTMNSQGVRKNQLFETPLGPLLKPRHRGSPGSVPANLIQCRCTRFMQVRQQGGEA